MPEKIPTVDVAAAVICEQERYLITLRYPQSHCGALWEFPGGKRHTGETLEACLHREIREELGVEILIDGLIATIAHSYPEREVVLHFYSCRRVSGEPCAWGCAEFRWVKASQLPQFTFPEADALLLRKLIGPQRRKMR